MFRIMSENLANETLPAPMHDETSGPDSDAILAGWAFSGALLVLSVALPMFNVMAFFSGESLIHMCPLGSCQAVVATEAQRGWTMAWHVSGVGLFAVSALSIYGTVKGFGRPLAIAAIVISVPAAFAWLVVWSLFG